MYNTNCLVLANRIREQRCVASRQRPLAASNRHTGNEESPRGSRHVVLFKNRAIVTPLISPHHFPRSFPVLRFPHTAIVCSFDFFLFLLLLLFSVSGKRAVPNITKPRLRLRYHTVTCMYPRIIIHARPRLVCRNCADMTDSNWVRITMRFPYSYRRRRDKRINCQNVRPVHLKFAAICSRARYRETRSICFY